MAMPAKGANQLIDRQVRYHVHDDPQFDSKQKFLDAVTFNVPTIVDSKKTEPRQFYSLRHDMDELRSIGAGLTITGAGGSAKQLVDPQRTIGTAVEIDPRRNAKRDLFILKIGIGEKKVLITGCHHAREWISVEVPYLLAEYLILNFNDKPTTPKELRIKHLLLNRQVWIVPMVNPDGHMFTITSERMWRTNRRPVEITASDVADPSKNPIKAPQLKFNGFNKPDRKIDIEAGTFIGVDLNRNYPTATGLFPWGQETYLKGSEGHKFALRTSRDPRDCGNGTGFASGVFAGLEGNSEPESQAIAALMSNGFDAAISYHSFSEDLLFPDSAVEAKDKFTLGVAKGMEDIGATLNQGNSQLHGYPAFKGSELYPTTGDLMDFTYSKFPNRPSYTPEVRPDQSPANDSKHFSGLPEAEIEPTFVENLGPALAVINCAGFSGLGQQTAGNWTGPAQTFQVVSNCWQVFRNWKP
jgi:carboxypeptidase T